LGISESGRLLVFTRTNALIRVYDEVGNVIETHARRNGCHSGGAEGHGPLDDPGGTTEGNNRRTHEIYLSPRRTGGLNLHHGLKDLFGFGPILHSRGVRK
jgi:hypothetical protein